MAKVSRAYLEIRSLLLPAACGCVYTETLLARCPGEVAMPLGRSGHVCRRKGEGTEPELCQRLDMSFAQASSRPARCVPRTVCSHPPRGSPPVGGQP